MNTTYLTADELDKFAEFDHPFRVNDWGHDGFPDGSVTDDLPGVYAPSVYWYEGDSQEYIDGSGWEPVNGYSGQDRYSGPVMHASEFLGGGMAKEVLSTPGIYVVTTVEDPDDPDNPAGWMLLRRDLEPPRMKRNDNGSWYCWSCEKLVILFDDDEHYCEATGTRTHFHDDDTGDDE
jgi:hypothetical protein